MNKGIVEVRKLIEIQRKIAWRALQSLALRKVNLPKTALGLDAAYSRRYGGVAVAALVDINNCELIDYGIALGEPALQYIPGLLAFREAALFYAAINTLQQRNFDIVVVDGHGVSHPRYAGIATHMGLALGKPSIGVAKKKLYGIVKETRKREDCKDYPCIIGELRDKERNEMVLAYIVLPRDRDKSPIYVSPGAYISLDEAYKLIRKMLHIKPLKLPCPTYYADRVSKKTARGLDKGLITPRIIKKGRHLTLDKYLSTI